MECLPEWQGAYFAVKSWFGVLPLVERTLCRDR